VPVATAPVTSGDAKNSLISTAKLYWNGVLFSNAETTRRNSASVSLHGAEFAQ
jgi:hypothetical protein